MQQAHLAPGAAALLLVLCCCLRLLVLLLLLLLLVGPCAHPKRHGICRSMTQW
jgi:hypothetical protein